jgi:hypothetical protein
MKSNTKLLVVVSFFLFSNSSFGVTYKTTQNGNWTDTSTWSGTAPTNIIQSGDSVIINHTVVYNNPSDLSVSGVLCLDGETYLPDTLFIQSGRNVIVQPFGKLYVYNAAFINEVLVGGLNGIGSLQNTGGTCYFQNAYVEIAENWTNTGGINFFSDGTFIAGGDYVSTGTDTLQNACFDIGQHGTGNFNFSLGHIYFDHAAIKNDGANGSFELVSGRVEGIITAISYSSSGGVISTSPAVLDTVELDYYCLGAGMFMDPINTFRGEASSCPLAGNSFPCNTNVSPLPVDLLDFSGNNFNTHIELNWSTASEINNQKFEILRKFEEQTSFEVIGEVQGAGNSQEVLEYSFIDDDVKESKIVYYQLRQVDYDGASENSSVIRFLLNEEEDVVSVYPVPVRDNFTLNLPDNSNMSYRVINSLGEVVSQGALHQTTTIHTKLWSSGIYTIYAESDEKKQVIKIVLL